MGRFGDKEQKYLEFNGTLLGSSPKAYKFQADVWENPEWVPISQSKIIEHNEHSGAATLHITEWLCGKNGWRET